MLLTVIGESSPNYGAVYAIQQIAVSLAYSLAPILGGELVPWIGFPWLMRLMGLLNLAYGPFLVCSGIRESVRCLLQKRSEVPLASVEFAHTEGSYKRFYNAVD
ncbi:hypothetical protein RP20_CCG019189 [Aedes albopictus]|nr:hypothetical protein RP20_CCG019189 [Aedes albopictus]